MCIRDRVRTGRQRRVPPHPQDPRRTLHHPRRRRGVPGRRAGLPRRRGERHTGFACRQAFAAQHGRQPDDDDLHPVQSRLLRRGRRRRRRNPPRPGRLVGSPGSRLPAPGTTRQQSRKSAAPRIRQRRIIQEHRGKNAQIEPGTCPPMQSRPECTLRPAFLIFPQGYSSPSSGSATRIRPQYSQTISFLPWRISTWRCGGIRLKQPPQASRFTVTTASPLRTLLRMRP